MDSWKHDHHVPCWCDIMFSLCFLKLHAAHLYAKMLLLRSDFLNHQFNHTQSIVHRTDLKLDEIHIVNHLKTAFLVPKKVHHSASRIWDTPPPPGDHCFETWKRQTGPWTKHIAILFTNHKCIKNIYNFPQKKTRWSPRTRMPTRCQYRLSKLRQTNDENTQGRCNFFHGRSVATAAQRRRSAQPKLPREQHTCREK